ncbi:unnamed protein product [Ectocarpus sp. 12 AP-2014]
MEGNQEGYPDYAEELQKCKDFLAQYQALGEDTRKYVELMQRVVNREETVVELEIDDVLAFRSDSDFADNIVANAGRYEKLFCQAIDESLPEPSADIDQVADVWDVLQRQREIQRAEAQEQPDADLEDSPDNGFPVALVRRYELRLVPPSGMKAEALREVRAGAVGQLVRIRAMVTRVSDVQPLVSVVTYTCDACGFEVYHEVFSRQFTPVERCPSTVCRTNKNNGKLSMQTRGSRFMRYQEARIQELPDQVPIGHIPRAMTVHCRGGLTRMCSPGDIVSIAGVFLPVRYSGFRAMKAGLIADTFLQAQHIFRHKKSYDEMEVSASMEAAVDEAAEDPEVFSKLARSIAPEIYGHEDIKKALLLQLVGGVTRKLPDGMRIRGDINICLMGDPGVAKSQLLKYIASVAPRGVYTTGKGSSGVGLTAAVSKDAVTGEMALEGGALVLADRGICAIDEFDKMDESDRTAIHEVMEQQTVSIAKAGITTTLNARAAVLAAANPLYGRYNKRRAMSENINLPNSLLSRFDLLFLILDKADMESDIALARHVTFVHQFKKNPELDFEPFDPKFLKLYISQARMLEPHVPEELTSYIVEAYVALRAQSGQDAKNGDQTVMTARQLLSILRLSQSLARVRFLEGVTSEEVDEAIRLTHMSKASLADDEPRDGGDSQDMMSRIYTIIRDYVTGRGVSHVGYQTAEAMVVRKGFSVEQLRECLEEYADLNVVQQVNADRTQIDFVTQ